AAAGDHELAPLHHAIGSIEHKNGSALMTLLLTYGVHGAAHAPLHLGGVALVTQHFDDAFTGIITKELAAMLLVPGNTMTRQQSEKIVGRVARKGRAAETGVCR